VTGTEAVLAADFRGDAAALGWLHSAEVAKQWMEYVKDTEVSDITPPPAPVNLRLDGDELRWDCEADPDSGLAGFVIERDGVVVGGTLEQAKNPFGRPLFQNLQYSDTPPQPMAEMVWRDPAGAGVLSSYRVIAVNTRNGRTPSR
jgi:hypothetical protein